ncbi:MAG: SLBB domain-containing protein [Pseudomonadota bacterium]
MLGYSHLRLLVFLFLMVGATVTAVPNALAQEIPPELLEQLQQRQRSNGIRERIVSPVDRTGRQIPATTFGQSGEVPFGEFEGLDGPYYFEPLEFEPTALEIDYRSRLGQPELEQYGYDLFVDRRYNRRGKTAGRIGEDYVVGVGDEFAIILQGNEAADYITKVDSEGMLLVNGVSPVSAAGRTLGEIRKDVNARVAEAFIGTEVFLSLANLAQVTVIVSGEVSVPGTYQLTAQDTVLDALTRAERIRRTGSLRDIVVLRDGEQISIDLYAMLRGQAGADIQIRDGDQIIVQPIGSTYAVAGEVLRPAIYELPKGVTKISAQTALQIAGGSLRPRGYELVLSRFNVRGDEVVDRTTQQQSIIAGDGLLVVRTSARTRGKVSISGHVAAPGMRALVSTPTVKDLLQRSGGYLANPYLPFAALVRENPKTLNRIYEAISLLDESDQGLGAALQEGDRLVVFNRKDVEFLSSEAVRQVVLNRQYTGSLTCEPLQNLASTAQDVQTERYASILRGTFVFQAGRQERVAQVPSALDVEQQLLPTQETDRNARVDDAQLEEQTNAERKTVLASQCPAVYSNNQGLLGFTIEHVVTTLGSVRQPIALPVAGQQSLSTLVEFAGGLGFEAALDQVEVTRQSQVSGRGTLERLKFDLTQMNMDEIIVGPGSAVLFQSVITDQEPGTVLLSGEFTRPGVYTINRGEHLSSVIERAGGITRRAYPFGAVFTREEVRRAQRLALRRTVREINTALTTAALRNNASPESLASARQLTASVSNVESLGRLVVEADPRVLRIRKDLDVVLEPGDRLIMPKRPNHVLATGDVLNPGALQFVRGKKLSQYLAETGGIQVSADEKRLFVVYPNGVAKPVSRRLWRSSNEVLPPGSTIVVPKDTDPLAALELTREVTAILSQLTLSAASLAVIFND